MVTDYHFDILEFREKKKISIIIILSIFPVKLKLLPGVVATLIGDTDEENP